MSKTEFGDIARITERIVSLCGLIVQNWAPLQEHTTCEYKEMVAYPKLMLTWEGKTLLNEKKGGLWQK